MSSVNQTPMADYKSWPPIEKWPKECGEPQAPRNHHQPFDPLWYRDADINDPRQLLKARDSAVREQYIRLMRSKLIRAELEKCQRHEGVQHHTVCKYWKDLYLEAVERGDNELRGYKSIERTESNSMNQNH